MRRRFIVCYDISDPKRLRKMYRTMRGFGDPLQKSVFTCDLSSKERAHMVRAIPRIIDCQEDSVLIIDTGGLDAKRESLEYIGKAITPDEGRAAIIV